MKVILIGGQVVSANLQNLRYKPVSGSALDLHDDIQRVGYVGLDREVRDFDAALQYAGGEARNSLRRGIGMNCG